MATLKQRLHKKNSSGTYDVVHLETAASLVLMDSGTTVEAKIASMDTTIAGKAASNHNHSAANITSGTLAVARGGTGNTSVDTTPTSGSTKMCTSGGIYTALRGKAASSHTHTKAQITDFPTTMTPSAHTHAASDVTSGTLSADRIPGLAASKITSGTLAVARGGTGVTANPSLLVNLASTSAASVFAASPRPGVTGTLPVARGGTGVTTLAALKNALGVSGGILTKVELASFNLGLSVSEVEAEETEYLQHNISCNFLLSDYLLYMWVVTGVSGTAKYSNASKQGMTYAVSSSKDRADTQNTGDAVIYPNLYPPTPKTTSAVTFTGVDAYDIWVPYMTSNFSGIISAGNHDYNGSLSCTGFTIYESVHNSYHSSCYISLSVTGTCKLYGFKLV